MSKKGLRVLITGGAGFIGSHIADLLVAKGREEIGEIAVLDNFARGKPENLAPACEKGTVRIVEGDIRDRKLLAELIGGRDLVFHQAAMRITECAEKPQLAMEVMADATFHLLEEAVRAGVKKVVAASSASVYGMADEFPTSERHHPYNNRTLYGAAKLFNESLLRVFHETHGLNYVALRYFNAYGPRMDIYGVYTEVLIRWMEKIAAGQPPLILGDGKQTMEFVYVEDIARANILAAESAVTDEVFNIAPGVETSLNELAQTLLKVMGSDLQPEYGPERKVNPVRRRFADVSKARRMLGFETRVSLEEGLRNLVKWWQAQQIRQRQK